MNRENEVKELIVHILDIATVDVIRVLKSVSLVQGTMEVQQVYRGILTGCNQELGAYTSGMDRIRAAHWLVGYQRGITVETLEVVLREIYSEYATGERGRIIALINFITDLHPGLHATLCEYVFIPEYTQVVEAIHGVITNTAMIGHAYETAVKIIGQLPDEQLSALDDFIGYTPAKMGRPLSSMQ